MQPSHCIKLVFVLSLSLPIITNAANYTEEKSSTEFFASNNTIEIDAQTAFNRLKGDAQLALQDDIVSFLQEERFEQSKFENLLGAFKSSDSQRINADNSEKIIMSSYQKFSPEKTFALALKLARVLMQESVAVFIPDKDPVTGDTILKLKSRRYTINETMKMIRNLPAQYNHAYWLHLNNDSGSKFENTYVDKVEWLGSKIKADEVKKLFPREEITSYYGKAYLIYTNGQSELL